MTAQLIGFHVHGEPVPQGSKRAFINPRTQRAVVVEQQSSRIQTWREAVKGAALAEMILTPEPWYPMPGPIHIEITFYLKRPAAHYGSGRNALVLKGSAPRWPAKMPDLDKLQRSTFDALTEVGVWNDDGQIVSANITKQFAPHGTPGADVRITDLDQIADVVCTAVHTVEVSEALL